MDKLTTSTRQEIVSKYDKWEEDWNDTLNKRSTQKSGKTQFRHKRLRSAMHSLDSFMPYLFTYEDIGCKGMPNTNNMIEGSSSYLKKNINNHSGMTKENSKRFISSYFLSLE